MRTEQMKAARRAMTDWLSHPQELGKAPAKMECAGEFDLYGLHYYIFKFKTGLLGKWLLGVCGGYEDSSLEHCGHVYSEMEEYSEATAVERATAMVEMIREHWMKQAERAEEGKKTTGAFLGFVLLSEESWDKEQLRRDLKTQWGLEVTGDNGEIEENLVFPVGDMMAVIGLMPAPVPNGEAEQNAAGNYLWPQAVETAKTHKAHFMVAVMGTEPNPLERGKLFVKLMACCCKQKNALGLYTSGTVFEPRFYEECAEMMKKDMLPILNWIWFGLYRREGGVCCYTYGMDKFGKDEMEVLDADGKPSDIRNFLRNIAAYVLEGDVTLKDGETIGVSAEDIHPITRSEGASLPGMTLKIEF